MFKMHRLYGTELQIQTINVFYMRQAWMLTITVMALRFWKFNTRSSSSSVLALLWWFWGYFIIYGQSFDHIICIYIYILTSNHKIARFDFDQHTLHLHGSAPSSQSKDSFIYTYFIFSLIYTYFVFASYIICTIMYLIFIRVLIISSYVKNNIFIFIYKFSSITHLINS